MTPEEKAKELIEKFVRLEPEVFIHGNPRNSIMTTKSAKRCAEICVAEMLRLDLFWEDEKIVVEYLKQVTEEIKKL